MIIGHFWYYLDITTPRKMNIWILKIGTWNCLIPVGGSLSPGVEEIVMDTLWFWITPHHKDENVLFSEHTSWTTFLPLSLLLLTLDQYHSVLSPIPWTASILQAIATWCLFPLHWNCFNNSSNIQFNRCCHCFLTLLF